MQILFVFIYIASLGFISACGELEPDESTRRISEKIEEFGLAGSYELSSAACSDSDAVIKGFAEETTTMTIADDVIGFFVDSSNCEATYLYEITRLDESRISANKRNFKVSDEETCHPGLQGITGDYKFENAVLRIEDSKGCAPYVKVK